MDCQSHAPLTLTVILPLEDSGSPYWCSLLGVPEAGRPDVAGKNLITNEMS